jgi:chitinase
LCTHLIYTFFGIAEDGSLEILNPQIDLDKNNGKGYIKKFNKLKKINPQLKTLAAIGGGNEKSSKYSRIVQDPVKRKRFARQAKKFVLQYGFNGIDMDWEYPAQNGGSASDKQNFVRFLKDIKKE